MTVLLDANILIRTVDLSAPLRPVAIAAVAILATQGHTPVIVPQALYEFWVVATRPQDKNGLGFSPQTCQRELATFQTYYPLRPDLPGLYPAWEELVTTFGVIGKPAHDARYVAAMRTHGIARILTFNGGDFARFPDITVLDPHAVAAAHSPTGTP